MKQSGVFAYVYEALVRKLSAYGDTYKLLSVPFEGQLSDTPLVSVSVCDVAQTQIDKSGQRVVIDELLYEVPTRFALLLQIRVYAQEYSAVLAALGEIAVCLKDDPAVPAEEFNWHGNDCGKIFFEPIVRRLDIGATAAEAPYCTASLSYCAECAVNSERGESFRRVEKTDMRSNVMDDGSRKDS